MMNAAVTMEVNAESFVSLNEQQLSVKEIIQKIDANKPLAVVIGVSLSVPAFFGMLSIGMNVERVLLDTVLLEVPVQTLASAVIGMSIPAAAATLKAGFDGDAVKALAYGGGASFLIGMLGAIAGF